MGVGKPNLAVYSGDLKGDSEDYLRVRVGNVGFGPLTESFSVRVSQCQLDSTDCASVYETRVAGGLVPGGAEVRFPWGRFGEQLFSPKLNLAKRKLHSRTTARFNMSASFRSAT